MSGLLKPQAQASKAFFDGYRNVLMPAATRSGKTAYIPIAICTIAQIYGRKIKVLVTEPTNDMVRRVLFKEYIEGDESPWMKIFPDGKLLKSEKIFECSTARVYFAGMDVPERIEGVAYDLVCMDELFQCRQEAPQIAMSRTGQTEGYCFFGSTPYHKKTWYRKWVPLKLNDPDWSVIHVSAYDIIKTADNPNGVFTANELERQRKELPDWLFRQRYLADWAARAEGIIFDIPRDNIIESDGKRYTKYMAGLDFGESEGHPAGFVLMGIDGLENKVIIDEFKKPCRGDSEYNREIETVLKRNKLNKNEVHIFADDARPGQIHALSSEYHYRIKAAKKGRVLDGIATAQTEIKKGLKFYSDRCRKLISECDYYSMNDDLKIPAPYKTDDDLCDAFRYLLVSAQRVKTANASEIPEQNTRDRNSRSILSRNRGR